MPAFKRKTTIRHRRPYKKRRIGYKKSSVAKTAARIVKRKEENRITTVTLKKGVDQLFPDRMCAKMKNEFVINWTGTAGAVNGFACCANGLHLPLSSGPISGASPITVGSATAIYGLPNILSADAAFSSGGPYNQYRVISTAVFYSTQNTSTSNNADVATIICTPVDGNDLSNMGNVNSFNLGILAEMPYAQVTQVGGLTVNKGVRCRHSMSTARQYALKYKATLEANEYAGTQGTNPSNLWYWVWSWFPATSANTSATTLVRIEYWIEFFNRNMLGTSSG